VNWDRATDVLTARQSTQRLAVTSGGTIPDRGLYGVFLAGDKGPRVGELDEEMVYESRPGETFVLGASTWLIEDITADRVLVTPAPGQPGKMPFWHGDAPGRPAELGRAVGSFVRGLMSVEEVERAERLRATGLDEMAVGNLLSYLSEQKDATGALPDDRTIVVERFRDELGDWRLCIHSPFGARLHAPWAQAIEARVRSRLGIEVQCIYTDDGIVVRWPEIDVSPAADLLFFDADEIEDVVVEEVGGSALFASRFRECSARALLLPKRRPGSRTPLWQQRRRSAHLLQVASKYRSFPVVLETYRECLQDVFDLPGLKELMGSIARRQIRVVEVETPFPSPYASALQFGFVSAFLYEGDTPLAERRAQALSLDRSLLAEIMGHEELRELVDEEALTQLELELQLLTEERKVRTADALHDALRSIGDMTVEEVRQRSAAPGEVAGWLTDLDGSRRAIEVRIGGEARWIAIEDAGRLRDALGVALPVGVPTAFLESVADPLGDLVARYARTHGPFQPADVASRLSLGVAVVEQALKRLEIDGRVVEGEFRPGGSGTEWVDVEVLRRLRRASLAAFRREVEPAPPEALARFAVAWHRAGEHKPRSSDVSALLDVVEQLQGAPLAASALETAILPVRLAGYSPSLLDELCASGELVWAGSGALGSDDGWIHLAPADRAGLFLPQPSESDLSDTARLIRSALERRGALFFRQIAEEVGSTDDTELLLSLWELVWAGLATNDTLAPLRALLGGSRSAQRRSGRRRPALPARIGPPSGAGRWSLTPAREENPTRRTHALAEQLLQRHGILTRGALAGERVAGGFAAIYPVLKAMEESGRCRRGYFVEGLGGAQFAFGAAVDRMRAFVDDGTRSAVVLAATDPANPYGAALPWPDRPDEGGHRAGRKAGALVVLVDGKIALYLEKGGRSLLSFSDDEEILERAVVALGGHVASGTAGRLSIERADGSPIQETRFGDALVSAGFRLTSRGLRAGV
jgi:ATP-dependent Lhr-like helicase